MLNSKQSDFNFGALFGGLIGFAVAALIWTVPQAQSGHSWIYDFQTLLAGVFAVVIGAGSVWGLHFQIRQAEVQSKIGQERELFAVRPSLVFALVEIDNYAQECFNVLRESYRSKIPNSNGFVDFPVFSHALPPMPVAVFADLKGNMKYGTNSAREIIAKLVATLQIQNSRLLFVKSNCDNSSSIHVDELHIFAEDSLKLSAFCHHLFPYSRREVDEIETQISSKFLFQAAGHWEIFQSQDPLVMHILSLNSNL